MSRSRLWCFSGSKLLISCCFETGDEQEFLVTLSSGKSRMICCDGSKYGPFPASHSSSDAEGQQIGGWGWRCAAAAYQCCTSQCCCHVDALRLMPPTPTMRASCCCYKLHCTAPRPLSKPLYKCHDQPLILLGVDTQNKKPN